MTDVDFYESLIRCVSADALCYQRKEKRCASCPLVASGRPCEYELIDEIRHRLILARQQRSAGYKQLSLI